MADNKLKQGLDSDPPKAHSCSPTRQSPTARLSPTPKRRSKFFQNLHKNFVIIRTSEYKVVRVKKSQRLFSNHSTRWIFLALYTTIIHFWLLTLNKAKIPKNCDNDVDVLRDHPCASLSQEARWVEALQYHVQYHAIPCNTMLYHHSVSCNTL